MIFRNKGQYAQLSQWKNNQDTFLTGSVRFLFNVLRSVQILIFTGRCEYLGRYSSWQVSARPALGFIISSQTADVSAGKQMFCLVCHY